MSRTVYVNGAFVAEDEARISIFDRGFLFADGVYEVSSVVDGRLIDNAAHLQRLRRSLQALEMPAPATDAEISAIQQALIERNGVGEGLVYLQVTRGAADRDFLYPRQPIPSLVMFTQQKNLLNDPKAEQGLKVVTSADIRWARRDIKTVGLLAQCMAKNLAVAQGADDAWMVEQGLVTEGSSSNAYIVNTEGVIITRQLGNEILHGVTRRTLLHCARAAGYRIEERPFSAAEAYQAAEAFITSATSFVMPVVKIDDAVLGQGRPGPVVRRLRQLYIEQVRNLASDG